MVENFVLISPCFTRDQCHLKQLTHLVVYLAVDQFFSQITHGFISKLYPIVWLVSCS